MSEIKTSVPADKENSALVAEFVPIESAEIAKPAVAAGLPALMWACPAAAADYAPAALSPADALRAGAQRTPRGELQWRVSRAALQQAGATVAGEGAGERHSTGPAAAQSWSLSHSDGHALVAHGSTGWRVGVDLERKRVRDQEALAQWCCDAAEQAHLLALSEADRLTFFYQLWTLKESFIKAAGLDFPADMRKVGLRAVADGWALRSPSGSWDACCWTIGDDWVASVVWSVPDEERVKPAILGNHPTWRVAGNCVLPPVRMLYSTLGGASA